MKTATLTTPTVRIVLYEGAGAASLAAAQRADLMRTLLDAGLTVTSTAHTDRVAPGTIASSDGATLIVLGRFDDGPPDAEDAAGRVALEFIDITNAQPADALERIDAYLTERDVKRNAPGKWKPWFPVIDYDRCTNCMQCLSFCLFDVYGVDSDKQIQVQNNDNCKTDCPACSRVCPEVAIMFPKYASGPINGDVVREADVKREAMKVDISALLGGDIYSRLKERSDDAKKRFEKERDDKRALSERMRCLAKIAKEMEIPMDVLKTLPTQDEIRQKTAAAQERAQAALGDAE